MEKRKFNLELFLKSFEMAGATVKRGSGRFLDNGKEIDPATVLRNEIGGFSLTAEAELAIDTASI